MRLLIVDDNELMRRLIENVVSDIADSIDECPSGEEAVRMYAQNRYDWVVMDIEMPGMDGLAATGQIVTADPSARVVIVTQYDNRNLRDEAAKVGAVGFVGKENLLELRALLTAET